ncbi:MAG TPA: phage portal protein [Solirubrobacteraceae bacterium]|nr:phage portal protein [Solirubrobacteraceae bacterium]
MPLSQSSVIELFRDRLLPIFVNERARVDALDLWVCGKGEPLTLPRKATKEHKALAELARTPLIGLVITNTAQGLFADGYRNPDAAEDAAGWATWQANDLAFRQSAIHRAALGHGLSYATVLPGMDSEGPRSVIRGVSARKMVTVYQDPGEDDWPMFALRRESSGSKYLWRIYDEEAIYFLSSDTSGDDIEYVETRKHDAGVCPVVRYTNLLDLDGNADSDIEALIPLAGRYNKTVYDRLLTQHFNSWKVRTIAGLQEFAKDEVTAERKKIKLAQDDILVAEDPDTKFGTLDETPLEGFIKAGADDLDTLSAVAQVPSTALTGKVANLSADAIAELRAGLAQKIFERQQSFGKSHAQALRLAYRLETGEDGDFTAEMQWRDMQPRTMAQVVDALGKAAQMLEVPPQAVWHLIPGVSKSDVDDWKAEADTTRARQARQAIAQAAAQARANGTVAGLNSAISNAG